MNSMENAHGGHPLSREFRLAATPVIATERSLDR